MISSNMLLPKNEDAFCSMYSAVCIDFVKERNNLQLGVYLKEQSLDIHIGKECMNVEKLQAKRYLLIVTEEN